MPLVAVYYTCLCVYNRPMDRAKFDLKFHSSGAPLLAGSSAAFMQFHGAMEKTILAQHREESYRKGYNFAIESPETWFRDLYASVLDSVREMHKQIFGKDLAISHRNKSACWAYVIDETRPKVGVWHNHVRTSTYNCVYYVRADHDDAIRLIIPRESSNPSIGQKIDIPAQAGLLLVMPSWLFHKEKVIERRVVPRISINMEILTENHLEVDQFFATHSAFGVHPREANG